MLKNIYENNENKKVNSREIDKLKENFPQYFNKDGDFKIDEFKKMLEDDEVNFDKEGYRLDFLGKSYARFESALETETVITPDTKHNNEEINKNSENMYIVGDNIDALKHLLKSYSGKVKCIYIDPPYNTGSDGFVYPDNFKFDKDTLSNKMGVSEEEADRILSLQGKSTHSAWLTFMYPRLLLARDLLADDGVIFISIDDNEQANLKMICDEIFGEENIVENLVWKRRATPPNDRIIGKNHEYIALYSKNNASIQLNLQRRTKKMNSQYSNPDNDPRGPRSYSDLSGNGKGGRLVPSCIYPIVNPNTGEKHFPPKNKCWLYNEQTMKTLQRDNRIVFRGHNGKPYKKKFLSEVRNGATLPTLIEDSYFNYDLDLSGAPTSQDSSKEIKDLFEIDIFEFPKPTKLIKKFMLSGLNKDDYALDFFSGSATTADSIMQLNAEDGGNRKYILVQIPEKIEKNKSSYNAGYRTIDEIGRERIKRAASKIKEETDADIDYGFKLYRLNESTVQTVDKLIDFDSNDINFNEDDYVSNFEFNGENGRDTILTTWLNEDGYGLLAKAESLKIGNYEADKYKNSLYIIEPGIKSNDIMELIKLIERNQLNINRIVVYGYSLNFNVANELRNNLKNLKNNQSVSLIERY
ncbi:DNA methyltransferase [Anaerococcus nagyae]|uniref:site-specific DNA-methyltransferase n=1 Tax=Anaerococcus nagyae TaxID=1755241 RepID=UPI003735FB76